MKVSYKDIELYAITDNRWLNGRKLSEVVEDILNNGATFLQLRDKEATHEELVAEAKELKVIAAKYKVPFVVNDDVLAAKEADADGVHIGQSDTAYEEARKILGPDKIIGMTAKTVEQAQMAEKLGADYIGTGAVFHTSTKTDAKDMKLKTLVTVAESVDMPVVAIGGITYDNMDKVKDTGVSGIAVVSALFGADNPGAATRKMKEKCDKIFNYNPRNIIFDMDGTLIDSNGVWKDVDREFLARRGLPYTRAYYEGVAHTIFPLAAKFTKEFCHLPESEEAIMAEWMELAKDAYAHVTVKPGVRAFLKQCRMENRRMALVTSSVPVHCRTAMEKLGLMKYFESVTFAQELGLEKKDKQLWLTVARQLGVEPESCTLFDDSLAACRGARSAKMRVVGVYDDFFAGDEKEMRAFCDVYITGFEELLWRL